MLGVVNSLCDSLNAQLETNGCSITANDWSALLGLDRSRHYGGQFNGNQCRTLLKNTQCLKKLLQNAGAHSVGAPILDAFVRLNEVRNSCFRVKLNAKYKIHICRFANAFLALGKSVMPKFHAIFVHVAHFIEKFRHLGKGLGYWSEQASESVHCDFDSLWIGSKYKRAMSHEQYTSQLLKCAVVYNSRNQ